MKAHRETGDIANTKRSGVPKLTSTAGDKYLIIESKICGMKTSLRLTAEHFSSQQQTVSLANVIIRLGLSDG